jgi:hypothetical protein
MSRGRSRVTSYLFRRMRILVTRVRSLTVPELVIRDSRFQWDGVGGGESRGFSLS